MELDAVFTATSAGGSPRSQDSESEVSQSMTEDDMVKALTCAPHRPVEWTLSLGSIVSLPQHWLVDSWAFSTTISVVVLINAIQMGFEVDYPQLDHVWKVFNYTFGAVFMCEMLLKLACLRLDYFRDRWNWLDGSLATMGFLDTWVVLIVGGSNLGLSQFSILRLLRLLRLMRLARLFRQFQKLAVVVKSIVDAMESSLWVASLLVICIYVCAIFCVGLIGHAPEGTYPGYTDDPDEIDESSDIKSFNPYLVFGSMSTAMMSLFNIAIMAEWTEIVRPVLLKQPAMALFFLVFAMFVVFGVMNVVIGMIVDNVMQNARALEEEHEQQLFTEKTKMIQRVIDLVFHQDKNGDWQIDMNEVETLLNTRNQRIRKLMSTLNLPSGCTSEEFIDLLDKDGNGKLEKDEFCNTFFRLMSAGEFERACMVQMGVNRIRRMSITMEESLNKVSKQLAEQSLLLASLCKDNSNCKDNSSVAVQGECTITASATPEANSPRMVSMRC